MHSSWSKRLLVQYSTPEYRFFFGLMAMIVLVLSLWTQVLMPVLVALTLAYLLETPVRYLVAWRLHLSVAVALMLLLLVMALVLAVLALLPVGFQQGQ